MTWERINGVVKLKCFVEASVWNSVRINYRKTRLISDDAKGEEARFVCTSKESELDSEAEL